jgi:hypothetical protein
VEDQPIRDERICEALEACRPGSADLADPALSQLAAAMAVDPALEELHRRVERIDARLAAAFHDVPVPEGLAERLLRQLSAAQALQADAVHEGREESRDGEEPAAPVVRPAALSRAASRVSRRWLVAAAVPLCAAAGLLIAFFLNNQQVKYSADRVMEDAAALFCNEEHPEGRTEPWPNSFPFSRDVLWMPGTTWRPVSGLLDSDAVAYDLRGPGGVRATLYVIRCEADVADEPSRQPAPTTGNCSAAAWKENGLVYVLVVKGGEADYRSFLERPRTVV